MRLFPLLHEPVPFEVVAAVSDNATLRLRGGPMAAVRISGRHLAAALEAAGYRVDRSALDSNSACYRRDGAAHTAPRRLAAHATWRNIDLAPYGSVRSLPPGPRCLHPQLD